MFTAFCFRAARSDRYRPMRSAAPYKSSGDADATDILARTIRSNTFSLGPFGPTYSFADHGPFGPGPLFVLSVIRRDSVTEHCGEPTVTPPLRTCGVSCGIHNHVSPAGRRRSFGGLILWPSLPSYVFIFSTST